MLEDSDDENGGIIRDRRRGWFRFEVSIGNVIQLVILMVAIIVAWFRLQTNYEMLSLRLNLFIEQQEKEKNIRESIDQMNQKLEALQKLIEARTMELRRRIG